MKQTIEICTCDICGREQVLMKDVNTIAYRTFDSTDGKHIYEAPKYEKVKLDLCEECLRKTVSIHSVGVQCTQYKINSILK